MCVLALLLRLGFMFAVDNGRQFITGQAARTFLVAMALAGLLLRRGLPEHVCGDSRIPAAGATTAVRVLLSTSQAHQLTLLFSSAATLRLCTLAGNPDRHARTLLVVAMQETPHAGEPDGPSTQTDFITQLRSQRPCGLGVVDFDVIAA